MQLIVTTVGGSDREQFSIRGSTIPWLGQRTREVHQIANIGSAREQNREHDREQMLG